MIGLYHFALEHADLVIRPLASELLPEGEWIIKRHGNSFLIYRQAWFRHGQLFVHFEVGVSPQKIGYGKLVFQVDSEMRLGKKVSMIALQDPRVRGIAKAVKARTNIRNDVARSIVRKVYKLNHGRSDLDGVLRRAFSDWSFIVGIIDDAIDKLVESGSLVP